MTQKDEHIINLDLPINERWAFLIDYKSEINELLQYYLNDFEGGEFIFESIGEYKKEIISKEYLEEVEYISSISNFTSDQVLIANLYYDVLKFYFGCTAFALKVNDNILHSRNLDWWTENNILSDYSKVFLYQKNGKTIYKTVGWVGFIGALSGTKPERFSLTLNAVLSNDNPEIALPVSFLLRDILSNANNFKEAKEMLEQTTIASDCLILLSGTKENEMVVIERTPKRYATRIAENGFITVTNDYKKLENSLKEESVLQSTSCGRFNRTEELIKKKHPTNTQECFDILKDEKVMMGITVQQMVFNNNNGEIKLVKTGGNKKYT